VDLVDFIHFFFIEDQIIDVTIKYDDKDDFQKDIDIQFEYKNEGLKFNLILNKPGNINESMEYIDRLNLSTVIITNYEQNNFKIVCYL
jgi:hypothetical protein